MKDVSDMMSVSEFKPKCKCGSDLFFIADKWFTCFKCKERYSKNQFWGTVFKSISNQDWTENRSLRNI